RTIYHLTLPPTLILICRIRKEIATFEICPNLIYFCITVDHLSIEKHEGTRGAELECRNRKCFGLMAPGETGDFCNDHYHGGSALDVELTRRVGTTLEEGTEVAVAVETSGSWRRVRASSETPWEPTSSAKWRQDVSLKGCHPSWRRDETGIKRRRVGIYLFVDLRRRTD
ncbi:unnamed protein product, partial [Heterotrigona itama]